LILNREILPEALMHIPLWLGFAMVALVFWGITGVTQKLSTNNVSTELSFLWFGVAMVMLALIFLPHVARHWNLAPKDFWLAVIGGTINSLGAYTSFAALEKGGKASIVIPLCYLYPLLTVVLAIAFLHETLSRVQAGGILVALVAAVLLSQEAPAQSGHLK
jgi:bacterial/archaeal transporter family protein